MGHDLTRPRRMMAWLACRSREITDWLFQGPDEQARQYGWTVEIRHGGLSRRYRDPRFDSLAGANPADATAGTRPFSKRPLSPARAIGR